MFSRSRATFSIIYWPFRKKKKNSKLGGSEISYPLLLRWWCDGCLSFRLLPFSPAVRKSVETNNKSGFTTTTNCWVRRMVVTSLKGWLEYAGEGGGSCEVSCVQHEYWCTIGSRNFVTRVNWGKARRGMKKGVRIISFVTRRHLCAARPSVIMHNEQVMVVIAGRRGAPETFANGNFRDNRFWPHFTRFLRQSNPCRTISYADNSLMK